MKDYASMSDFEINKSVADIAMNGTWHVKPSHPDNDTGGWLYGSNGIQTYELPDYCNNPADAWPIIIGQKLSLINADDEWLCVPDYATVDGVAGDDIQKIYFSYGYVDANPLRCAMIVFLMMKESENDSQS